MPRECRPSCDFGGAAVARVKRVSLQLFFFFFCFKSICLTVARDSKRISTLPLPSCPSTYEKKLETFEQEMNADRNHSSNLLHNGCEPAVCHIIPVQ